jgi:signal transduction histidine kinase
MPIRSAGKALRRRDLVASAWPWRATAYLLSGLPVGVVVLTVLTTLIALGVVSAVAVVGVPLLVAATLVGLPVGAVERRRLGLVDAEPIDDPHRIPERPGLRAWLHQRYREPATWRELGYTILLATLIWPLDLLVVGCALGAPGSLITAPAVQALGGDGEVKLFKAILLTSPAAAWAAVPIGVVLLVPAAYVVTGYGAARGALARALLAPRDNELVRRVQDLTRSRARLVDAFDAERRRIERDLHDGAQQRLVALGITLGLARLATPADVPALVERAHEQASLALEELRDLVRGVDVALPTRPPSAVETAAYFVVCEALANAAKHSGATRIQVSGRVRANQLVVEVADDGCGGADAARGSGLAGLADRIAVVAGRLVLTSPPGGPTLLRVELPCHQTSRSELSSPRTVS